MRSLLAALLAVNLTATAACRSRGTDSARPAAGSDRAANLLLITIDTLRADHVGAYGYARARTPALDAIARGGVRFDRAFATAPITLTSHASLLTGRYPPGHGARHNRIRMQPVPTLATLLRAKGFATGAFIAAFPLDRRFGLAEGFDTYSDRMPRGNDGRPLNERPGRLVADEAIAWLAAHPAGRFFLWVHFFEPHAPYGDPSTAATRSVIDRYDDEIAVADEEAGRVIAALGGRAASTLIVAAGDHGEAFGEHGEVSHSVFVYDTTLMVPLLMKGPGLGASASVIASPVSLIDVAPTILAALGLPRGDVDGVDLRPLVAGRGETRDRVIYSESFAPLVDFGWSSLRAVRAGEWKYIAAPRPELYDLAADPAESSSVASSRPDVARTLDARVNGFSGAELPAGTLRTTSADPDAVRRLQALGYVGASRPAAPGARPDPKDRRALARSLALVFANEVQGAALEQTLVSILREDPANTQAHLRLGYALLADGRCRDAEPHFRAAEQMGTADPWLGLAMCAGARGDLRGSETALERADAVEPGNPVVAANRGIIYSKSGRSREAIDLLSKVVSDDPGFDEARFNLALAYARAGRRQEAEAQTLELLRRLPLNAPQRPEVERLLAALE